MTGSHDELLEQAKTLEKSLSDPDKLSWAFRYGYVANHELRLVIQQLKSLTKLVWGILIAIVLTLGSAVIGAICKFLME